MTEHEPPRTAIDQLLDATADSLDEGRPEEALGRAEEIIAEAPHSVPALHYRAAALEELGRIAEARVAYDRALLVGRDDPALLLDAARFLVEGLPHDEQERIDLEEGLTRAQRGVRAAERKGEAEQDTLARLHLVAASALAALGEPREALASVAKAEAVAPGHPEVLREKGLVLYDLCRFEDARDALVAAAAEDPDDPWTAHALGLLAERRGDTQEARRCFARARALSPEDFPLPVTLSHSAFELAVEDALTDLPEDVRRYLSNVAITVEDLPADADLLASDPPLSPSILGLFRGAPYGQKASMDPWSHFPSSIVLYQRNLERFALSREDLIEQIGVTLVHEVGHFLGLDEDELYQRGLE